MPYSPEHKAKTRGRIVASARKLFNPRGFAEVSIDEIMADAGLTRGGFYNHFATKDELHAEAVGEILRCDPEQWKVAGIDIGARPDRVTSQIISAYLSDRHLENVDTACPLVALPSDVARGGEAVRRAYREVLEGMIRLFQSSQQGRADARERAVAMATLCVGGMVVARALDDETLSAEIRRVAETTAMRAGGFEAARAAAE